MSKHILYITAICSLLFICPDFALSLEPAIGDIVDVRSSGKVQGRLEVLLKITGEEAADVKGIRASVISAVDETGRDVTDVLRAEKQGRYSNVGAGEKSVRLYLKSPSRRATVLKELIGRLDLFIPRGDPESVVIIDDLPGKTGKPVESAALKSAGVDLTIMTKQQYEAFVREQAGATGAMATGGLVGISNLDDKSIVTSLKDADARVVALEFQTESGQRIIPRSSTGVGNVKIYSFADALPAKARLKIEVATLKSVVRVPFSFENILLP